MCTERKWNRTCDHLQVICHIQRGRRWDIVGHKRSVVTGGRYDGGQDADDQVDIDAPTPPKTDHDCK